MGCLAIVFSAFVVVGLWLGISLGESLVIAGSALLIYGLPLLGLLFVLSFLCSLFNGK
jgi:hypothetical protein